MNKEESKGKEVDVALQKAITNRMFLNPTIRLIRFGMMYNSRTDMLMKITDIDRDQQLQQEVVRERDNLFHLKHKPVDDNLSRFVKHVLENATSEVTPTKKMTTELKPYLESASIEDVKDEDSIKELNLDNCKEVMNKKKMMVVAVFSNRC